MLSNISPSIDQVSVINNSDYTPILCRDDIQTVDGKKWKSETWSNNCNDDNSPSVTFMYSMDTKERFQIVHIFTPEHLRRNGISSKFLNFAIDKGKEMGFDKVDVIITSSAEDARYEKMASFYKHNGFEFVGNSQTAMVKHILINRCGY